MDIKSDVNLKKYNTFQLDSLARYFFELTNVSQIPALIDFSKKQNLKIKFLGGGSNLILPAKLDALVVKNNLMGVSVKESDQHYTVTCASGENWHQFVLSSLAQGHWGIENLALIPGTVGGAPVQNIGAYGVEVNRFITHITGWEFETGQQQTLTNLECQFEYRNSVFKTPAFAHFLITSVEFQFPKTHSPVITYAELAAFFKDQSPTPLAVANKVIDIRQKKLPDVNSIPNVGSFFKNPIVAKEKLSQLKGKEADLISYPQPDGTFKLAAGQLIDKLGFKGKKEGTVSMYEKQALVMVNLGHGRIEDVNKLVSTISMDCFNRYGVRLEVEPIFW